jgi:malonyl CoA-acyl carrier protein transacylase
VAPKLDGIAAGAGHSLGVYSALVAARRFTVADAARLVRRRGELMLAAGRERPGAMAAVLGLATAEVEAACTEASGDGVAVAANLNAPDQTVISGDPPAVERAGAECRARGGGDDPAPHQGTACGGGRGGAGACVGGHDHLSGSTKHDCATCAHGSAQ